MMVKEPATGIWKGEQWVDLKLIQLFTSHYNCRYVFHDDNNRFAISHSNNLLVGMYHLHSYNIKCTGVCVCVFVCACVYMHV